MGLIGVPLLALAVPLVQAAAIMLPILCLMDLFAVWSYRREWSREHVRALLPPAILGIALGAWAFQALDERGIRLIVGVLAVAFSTQYWIGLWRRGGSEPPPARPGATSARIWGLLSGFTSTVAHAAGPTMSVYLLPLRLAPSLYVGTSVVLFFVFNYVKLIPYAWLGQLHAENLWTSLALAPVRLCNSTFVQHNNLVGILNSGKPMCDYQRCPVLHQGIKRFLDAPLGLRIQRRRCLIENQYRRVF